MIFAYRVDDDIMLELQAPTQDKLLFGLVEANRDFIGRYMPWAQRIHTVEDMRQYMQRDLRGMAQGRRWSWLIRYRGQAAGRIGLWVTIPEVGEYELNYWLAQAFTGKGILTRAARAVVDYAFTQLDLHHVLIGFAEDNHKSKGIAERLGFRYECTMCDNEWRGSEWHDVHFYGMLHDEWRVTRYPVFACGLGDGLALQLQQLHHAAIQHELVLRNQADLRERFLFAGEGYSLENERTYTMQMLEKYAGATGMMLGIWQQGALIGSIGLHIDSVRSAAEVTYWLDHETRGQGVTTRAVNAILTDCFEGRKLRRVALRVAVGNAASQRIAEKLGMRQEAVLHDDEFLNGRYVDQAVYSILAPEWEAQQR